ncbi:hypothetical protein ACQ4LE_009769 [Meloidogyne hapla]|uniref:Uncharacterized protein n=1 Tax=Meloidogyne hapla TaxID=6305 RepID=A0A1I8BB54_MELHA
MNHRRQRIPYLQIENGFFRNELEFVQDYWTNNSQLWIQQRPPARIQIGMATYNLCSDNPQRGPIICNTRLRVVRNDEGGVTVYRAGFHTHRINRAEEAIEVNQN